MRRLQHLNYEDDAFQERLKEVLEDTNSLMILLGTEMMEEDYQPFMDYKGYMIVLDGWCEEMAFDGVLIKQYGRCLQRGGISG